MVRRFLVTLALALVAAAAGVSYFVWSASSTAIGFAAPAPSLVGETTLPIATVTTTAAISTTTASVVPETTTTAEVASTVPAPVPVLDPAEQVCAQSYGNYLYIPRLEGLCRPLDLKDRDENGEFTPSPDHVSIDAAQSLPGAADKGFLSYLSGHVNQSNGVNVLERLPELQIGDVFVTSFGGDRHSFVIYARYDWDKDEVATNGGALLQGMSSRETWIATCGGEFNPLRRSYENNLIVLARPVS